MGERRKRSRDELGLIEHGLSNDDTVTTNRSEQLDVRCFKYVVS